ncbi:MAG: type II toxin-antitoxin system VapC family toxin [Candidatus Heimdallarchaeota archaeon]
MRPVIADTNFLSDILAGKSSAKKALTEIITDGYYIITTVITTSELFFGAKRRNWQETRVVKLEEFIDSLQVLDFTLEHSKIFGSLRAELVDVGQDIGFADTAIAAIALSLDLPIISANVKHFKRIQNLKIVPYTS